MPNQEGISSPETTSEGKIQAMAQDSNSITKEEMLTSRDVPVGVQFLRVRSPRDDPVHIITVENLGNEVGVECEVKVIRLIWQGWWQSAEIALTRERKEFGFAGHDRDQSLIEVALHGHEDCLCEVGAEISQLNDLCV